MTRSLVTLKYLIQVSSANSHWNTPGGIIIACTWASYRAVKASALDVGRERLQNLTQQLSTLLQQSAANILTKTATVANEPGNARVREVS